MTAALAYAAGAHADASADAALGPYRADDFVVTTGDAAPIAPAPKLYFAKEWIAAPREGVPVSGHTRGTSADDDVRAWAGTEEAAARPGARPPLVWIGAPEKIRTARLSPDARRIATPDGERALRLAPRLDSNRSWFDESSAAFYAARAVSARGVTRGEDFEARTLWPEDFRIDEGAPLAPLPDGQPVADALRALVRADGGGARSPFLVRPLWERAPGTRSWAGKPAIVVMVNGAQGDDDEAWGGHFAIGTGRIGPDGAIADLLIDNFYSLDVVSEKGILAAPVPLDGYLADLNSGQAWYRPSAMLVAVLAGDEAPALVQGAFNRVYAQFWRHQLPYVHSTMNCAGISVDTLRALGLEVAPEEPGALSRAAGWLAIPWTLATERSLRTARIAYEYLATDRTRLFPAVAFETVGAELLRLAGAPAPVGGDGLPAVLARDLDAIVYLRVPQLPSSRAFGSWPVATPAEYRGRVPKDPQDAQIVPVPPRPFPSNLRDDDLRPEAARPSDLPLRIWTVIGVIATLAGAGLLLRLVARLLG